MKKILKLIVKFYIGFFAFIGFVEYADRMKGLNDIQSVELRGRLYGKELAYKIASLII